MNQDATQHSLLYIGVGSYESPRTGLDNVLRTHLTELALGNCDVTAILVSPTIAQYTQFNSGRCRIHVYPNLFHSGAGKARILWEKLRLAFLTRSSIQSISLFSPAARRHIRQLLDDRPTALIIDHVYSFATISPAWFSRKPDGIFICHDIITGGLMRSYVQYRRAGWRKALLLIQLAKSRLLARMIMKRAALTVFLSEHDRASCASLTRRSLALLPFAAGDSPAGVTPHDGSLLFIGSPDFEPNAFALRWLAERFAPALLHLDPVIRIVLVGKGCDAFIPPQAANIEAAGFLSGYAMQARLRSAVALICPVVHGGGVKIKILDAIMQHCPVLATMEALRGYEPFALTPEVHMDDPRRTARAAIALTGEECRRERVGHLAQALARYRRFRTGKLAALAEEIAHGSPA